MFKTETKNAMMAFAVVAMFMLSAFAIVLTPSDAATGDSETDLNDFTINMRVGDTFVYAPKANLPVNFTWTGATGADFTATPGAEGTAKLQYTPSAVATPTVTLRATTSDANAPSQHADQTIHFNVVDKIAFASSQTTINNFAASETYTSSLTETKILTFTVSGGDASLAFGTAKVNGSDFGESGVVGLGITKDNDTQMFVTVTPGIAKGDYVITMPASFSISGNGSTSNTASDQQTLTFTIHITDGISIVDQSGTTVISKNDVKTIVISNDDGAEDIEYEITSRSSTDTTLNSSTYLSGMSIIKDPSNNDGAINITGSSNDEMAADAQSSVIVLNVKATGTQSGTDVEASGQYTLTVYRALKFTTTPVVNFVTPTASSTNGLDVLLSTTIDGANKITYNWGDGTTYTQNIYSATSTFHSANHTYAKEGTYFIQITASNDFGDTTYIQPYTTGKFIGFVNEDKTLEMTNIKASEADGKMTLTPVVLQTAGVTPAYSWTYGDNEAVTSELSWVESVDATTGVLVIKTTGSDACPDDTKLKCTVSATFAGDDEPTTDSKSYTYNDTSTFMEKHGLLFGILIALGILAFVCAYFGFLLPIGATNQIILGVVLVIAGVIAFFTNDFGLGLWKF